MVVSDTPGSDRLISRRRRLSGALWLVVFSRGRKCLLEGGPEVLDVLAADADAQQVVWDHATFGGVAGAALERGLDAAEAGRVGADGDGLYEGIGAGGAPADAEGEHEAVAAEVVAAPLVLRVGRQAGVAHLVDLGVAVQPLGEHGRVTLRPLEAQRQRSQAA